MSLLQGTMTPIYTVTVGAGGQSSIQFNNIPQTYTDLVIRLSLRTTFAGVADDVIMTLNGLGSGYSNKIVYGNGSNLFSTNAYGNLVTSPPSANATSSIFGNVEIYIPNYTSSNAKSYSSESVSENNATESYIHFIGGINTTTNAITSVSFAPSGVRNFVEHSTATLYGVKNYALSQIDAGAKARGGIVTSDANYWYHTFTTSGTFTPTQSLTADYLVIAGGAGGGTGNGGGGGGAGGFLYTSGDSLTSTSYTVTVGAGGAGATDGNNSVFRSLTALKGARGGNSGNGGVGGAGYASGGGQGRDANPSPGGAGTAPQGYAGGGPAIGTNSNGGGGGGGAGGTGYPGKEDSSANNGGLGGIGISTYSAFGLATSTGENVSGTYYYCGGGGGAAVTGNSLGGYGGGGRAATFSLSGLPATSGPAGSGGGGGGGGNTGNWSSVPGNGGSGAVIIRYAK